MQGKEQSGGWIFSQKKDLIFFWGPLLFSMIFAFLPHSKYLDFVIGIIIADQLFNWTHALATMAPLARLKDNQLVTGIWVWSAVFVIGAVGYTLFKVSNTWFYTVLSYIGIGHIFRQQYGWVMVSRKKANETEKLRWLDVLEIWNIMLLPFFWWQSSMGTVPKMYFVPNDFIFFFPTNFVQVAYVLHWVIHIIYFIFQLKKKTVKNPGKYSLMFMTWVWLYGSLVIWQNSYMFWTCLLVVHALPYVIYSYNKNPNYVPFNIFPNHLSKGKSFILQIFTLGILWRVIGLGTIFLSIGRGWEFLIWWPLLCHYFFDKIIWTRRYDRAAVVL